MKLLFFTILSAPLLNNSSIVNYGFRDEDLIKHVNGFGYPSNLINYSYKFVQDLFQDKSIEMLYFGSMLVAGDIYRGVFKNNINERENYIGIEVYKKLPHYATAPVLKRMVVSSSIIDITNFFNMNDDQLEPKIKLNWDTMGSLINNFDFIMEMQKNSDRFLAQNKVKKIKVEYKEKNSDYLLNKSSDKLLSTDNNKETNEYITIGGSFFKKLDLLFQNVNDFVSKYTTTKKTEEVKNIPIETNNNTEIPVYTGGPVAFEYDNHDSLKQFSVEEDMSNGNEMHKKLVL